MPRASAWLVIVTKGPFEGDLAVAVEVDGRWRLRFKNRHTHDDLSGACFKTVCQLSRLDELLSVLDP
jgi:hypothetical protein